MANFQAQDYIKRQSPNLTVLKAVRIRPSDEPKFAGGLDEWMTVVANLDDKKIYAAAWYPKYLSDNTTIDKIERDPYTGGAEYSEFVKKKLGRKWPDTIANETALLDQIISSALKNQQGIINDYKIIQDPLDTNVVPPQEIKSKEVPTETKKSETTGNSEKQNQPPEVIPKPAIKTVTIRPSEVSGKIVLTKVSGPGEIIGETELTIGQIGYDYGVQFSGIQFSDAGEYVVSITSTSPDLESATFSVTVLPEPDIVSQDQTRGTEPIKDGLRPMITQIEKPTLQLKPIVLPLEVDRGTLEWSADSMGMMPFLSYSNNPIQDRDIVQLKLYHAGMIPKCSVTFVDSQNLIRNVGQPKDDTTFDVFIHARSNSLKSIHLSFVIEKFNQVSAGQYNMIGTLYIPGGQQLYRTSYGNFEGTSYEAIRDVVKKLSLGFNSNIVNTEDKMNWIYGGKKTWETMDEMVKNSYINDKSFMAGYIDFYYCFNYVDVQKEVDRDISKDVGVETGTDKGTKIDKIVAQKLNNEASMNKSAFYFAADPVTKQKNTAKNLKKGYRTVIKYYDRKKKKFCVFKIESNTSDGKTTYILKAAPYDKKSFAKNESHIDFGEIDLDNVHANYLYANELNRRNLDELSNVEMILQLPNVNLNIYKYQKIDILMVNTVPTAADSERIKWSHSGEWIITDITYNFITEGAAKKFFQEVKVIRKELNKSPTEIKKDGKPEAKPTKEEPKVENPIPVAPNAGFIVGNVYRLRDKDGKEWLMRVNLQNDDEKTIETYIVSMDTLPASQSQLISEKEQPIDQQTEKISTDQTKPSKEKEPLPPDSTDYESVILEILNPKSDADKKITGTITFKKLGPRLAAIGNMSGFPDGGTLSHEGALASSSQKDGLVREMIIILQNMIENKYNVSVKLNIKEKKL